MHFCDLDITIHMLTYTINAHLSSITGNKKPLDRVRYSAPNIGAGAEPMMCMNVCDERHPRARRRRTREV